MSLLEQLGENIRNERLNQGLSQEELAQRTGLHRTYIGMIERAEKNITVTTLARVSKALGVDIIYFLNDVDI